jgi:hypothetical protein
MNLSSLRKLTALALVPAVAVLALATVSAMFHASPDAERYAEAGNRLVRLSEDAREALTDLIAHDEVTWDPTNGSEMQTVLARLKHGRGERVLLLGSSQLITLRDDRSMGSFPRRVDKLLERGAARPVTVYNLSVGGMSAPEKALILERAANATRFDHVVLALTLWDSVSSSQRGLFERLSDTPRPRGETLGASDDRSGPAAVNRAVAESLEHWLGQHSAFFRDRAAIQAWLGDQLQAASVPAPLSIRSRDAAPMQYLYSGEELSSAMSNVRKLISTAATLGERHGFTVAVLLTPFRQDTQTPAYAPESYARFRASVRDACASRGIAVIDASELLGRSHFGVYELGENRGRIDVLHFDARGHALLAATLARALDLDTPQFALASTRPAANR